MSALRGKLDVDDLLKIVLALIAVVLVLEIVGRVLGLFVWLLDLLMPVLLLAGVVLIVLYFLGEL